MWFDGPHCQSFMWLGEKTGGNSTQPQFGICCLSGKIIIPAVPNPPDILMGIYTDNDVQSKHFWKNIRKFNSGMAMASMKTNDATLAGGLASYRIQGVVYRMIGPPRSSVDHTPACLQTYFFDTEEQVRLRSVREPPNPGEAQLDSDIYKMHSTVLTNEPNVYLMYFLTVQEQIDAGNIPPKVQFGIHADKRPDGEYARRYNLPSFHAQLWLVPPEMKPLHISLNTAHPACKSGAFISSFPHLYQVFLLLAHLTPPPPNFYRPIHQSSSLLAFHMPGPP